MEDQQNTKAVTRIRTRWKKETFVPDGVMEKKLHLDGRGTGN